MLSAFCMYTPILITVLMMVVPKLPCWVYNTIWCMSLEATPKLGILCLEPSRRDRFEFSKAN